MSQIEASLTQYQRAVAEFVRLARSLIRRQPVATVADSDCTPAAVMQTTKELGAHVHTLLENAMQQDRKEMELHQQLAQTNVRQAAAFLPLRRRG